MPHSKLPSPWNTSSAAPPWFCHSFRSPDLCAKYEHRTHDILVRSLKKVAEDAEGENGGWKIKQIIFVGGTSGSVHAQTLNDNLKELQVIESKRNEIRKGLEYELINVQDTVLCSYFAQRSGERSECQNQGVAADEVFQGLGNFE